MKTDPAANGDRFTPWQRLDRAFPTALKVSKEDFVKAEQAATPAKKVRKTSVAKTHPQ